VLHEQAAYPRGLPIQLSFQHLALTNIP
jgi:hypothetical protein